MVGSSFAGSNRDRLRRQARVASSTRKYLNRPASASFNLALVSSQTGMRPCWPAFSMADFAWANSVCLIRDSAR